MSTFANDQGSNQPTNWRVGHRGLAAASAIILFIGLAATLARIVLDYQTPGPFNPDAQGLCDFHNGIYFPTRAVLAGESPYSDAYAAKYPVARQIPFFSPVILFLHAPLAVVPLHIGEALNLLLQLGLLVGLTLVVIRVAGVPGRLDAALTVASMIVLSRGGHITLFTGYFTFQMILATWLALSWADRRPVASALALFVVSAKPTYILPLGFLMLARGHIRALVYGAALSIAGAAITLGWLAHQEGDGDLVAGAVILKDQITDTQAVHRSMEDESPVYSWTRLDLFAIIAKWRGEDPGDLPHLATMFAFLAIPMVIIRRLRMTRPKSESDVLSGLDGAIVLTALLVSLYHQSYDSLLLTAPIAAMLLGRVGDWRHVSAVQRGMLAGLLAIPALNYLSTRMFLLRLEVAEPWVKVLTSINGVGLAVALAWLCVLGWRISRCVGTRPI